MVHDFAKTVAQSKKRKNKSRQKNTGHSWLWLFAGIFTGIVLIVLFIVIRPDWLAPSMGGRSAVAVESSTDKIDADNNNITNSRKHTLEKIHETKNADGLRFEFYKRLQDHSIEVNIDEEFSALEDQKHKVFDYYLQAASLRHLDDALRMQEQIKSYGFAAQIASVELPNGIQWHRVQLGPFSSRLKRDRAANILVSHEIIPLEIDKPKDHPDVDKDVDVNSKSNR